MIDAQLRAVRQVREEADRLRLECVKAAQERAFLHIAFDRSVDFDTPADQLRLLGRLQ